MIRPPTPAAEAAGTIRPHSHATADRRPPRFARTMAAASDARSWAMAEGDDAPWHLCQRREAESRKAGRWWNRLLKPLISERQPASLGRRAVAGRGRCWRRAHAGQARPTGAGRTGPDRHVGQRRTRRAVRFAVRARTDAPDLPWPASPGRSGIQELAKSCRRGPSRPGAAPRSATRRQDRRASAPWRPGFEPAQSRTTDPLSLRRVAMRPASTRPRPRPGGRAPVSPTGLAAIRRAPRRPRAGTGRTAQPASRSSRSSLMPAPWPPGRHRPRGSPTPWPADLAAEAEDRDAPTSTPSRPRSGARERPTRRTMARTFTVAGALAASLVLGFYVQSGVTPSGATSAGALPGSVRNAGVAGRCGGNAGSARSPCSQLIAACRPRRPRPTPRARRAIARPGMRPPPTRDWLWEGSGRGPRQRRPGFKKARREPATARRSKARPRPDDRVARPSSTRRQRRCEHHGKCCTPAVTGSSSRAIWSPPVRPTAKRSASTRSTSAVLYDLGYVLQLQGNNDAAIDYYRRALAHQPRHAFAHYNLGTLLQAKGDPEAAIAHYRTAAALQPGKSVHLLRLGAVPRSHRRPRGRGSPVPEGDRPWPRPSSRARCAAAPGGAAAVEGWRGPHPVAQGCATARGSNGPWREIILDNSSMA